MKTAYVHKYISIGFTITKEYLAAQTLNSMFPLSVQDRFGSEYYASYKSARKAAMRRRYLRKVGMR